MYLLAPWRVGQKDSGESGAGFQVALVPQQHMPACLILQESSVQRFASFLRKLQLMAVNIVAEAEAEGSSVIRLG